MFSSSGLDIFWYSKLKTLSKAALIWFFRSTLSKCLSLQIAHSSSLIKTKPLYLNGFLIFHPPPENQYVVLFAFTRQTKDASKHFLCCLHSCGRFIYSNLACIRSVLRIIFRQKSEIKQQNFVEKHEHKNCKLKTIKLTVKNKQKRDPNS